MRQKVCTKYEIFSNNISKTTTSPKTIFLTDMLLFRMVELKVTVFEGEKCTYALGALFAVSWSVSGTILL